jgi:hypothetical protein
MKQALSMLALLLCAGAADARPIAVQRMTKDLEFRFRWPGEAAAIPALDRRFRAEAAKELRVNTKIAVEGRAEARKMKFPQQRYYYLEAWEVAGKSSRLLSLQGRVDQYTGGAHPNYAYSALIWDRTSNREIKTAELFPSPKVFTDLTRGVYCKRLDAERLKRREGEKLDLPEFNQCPKFSDLAIAPMDRDKNGLFDQFELVASPYTAGPYVEGDYSITVPLTRAMIAAMKPEYRPFFQSQRQ